MNPTQRTLMFVAAALVSTGIAYTSNQFTKPAQLADFGESDQDFFRDFTDPTTAASIRVVSYDETLAKSKKFIVVNDNGWRIPSHNDYPADGKDQLTKAATSIIGLKRGTFKTRRKTDHEHYGVIDPLDEENAATKGRGQRITLSQKGDFVLADLIVGKKVEGDDEKRYIRRADEDKVYMVRAKFDISTKFADWAETDLLKLAGFDVLRVRASQPKYNQDDELEGTEIVELNREKGGDPWKLGDLDETAEELKTDDINTMVSTLDDLRLVGVRPKPALFDGKPVLTPDLKISLPKELANDPGTLNQVKMLLRSSLSEKGFHVGQDESGQTQIVSREGELTSGTKDGVVYRLTFGSVFSGTEEEIEIGDKDDKGDLNKGEKETEVPKKVSQGKNEDLKKSRYLFVRAEFDEKLLGARPVEPEMPTPPPGVEPLAEDKPDGDADKTDADAKKKDAKSKEPDKDASPEKPPESKPTDSKKADEEPQGAEGDDKVAASSDDKKENDSDKNSQTKKSDLKKDEPKPDSKDENDKPAADKPAADKPGEDKPGEDKPGEDKPEPEAKKDEAKKTEPKTDPKAEYQEALKKYDVDKGRYNTDLKSFESRIESGQAKVKELNDRFADWYYVISNDSFDKLRLKRADLIKKKESPAASASDKPLSDQPASDKPAEDKPATDEPAESDTKPTNPAEKSADSEPPADQK